MKTNRISLVKLCETANVKPARLDSMNPLDRALAMFGMSAESLAKEAASHAGGQEDWEDTKKIPDANIILTISGGYDGVTIFVDAIDPNYGVPGDWEGIVGEEFPVSVPNSPDSSTLEEAEETNSAERIGNLIVDAIAELAQEDQNWEDPYEEDEDIMRDRGYRRPSRQRSGKYSGHLQFNYDWESVKEPGTGRTYCFSVTGEAFGDGAYDDGDYYNEPYNDFDVKSIKISKAEVWDEDADNEEHLHDVEQFLTSQKFEF